MAHGVVMILLVIFMYLKRPKDVDPGNGMAINAEAFASDDKDR